MASHNTPLVWLVTGCSSGFGKHIVEQALKRGQTVIATGRNVSRLSDLKAQGADVKELDPNAAPEKLAEFALYVLQQYGHIDVLVNNAGYMQEGIIEETR
jgi:NADP-dependent 3-hydroxy acid dehydrogenase YdfG